LILDIVKVIDNNFEENISFGNFRMKISRCRNFDIKLSFLEKTDI